MEYDLTYLSLGGGVQSSALLAMSAMGLKGCPKADVAIFADTQAEVKDTYDQIALLTKFAAKYGIPVETVTVGSIEKHMLGEEEARRSGYIISIPAFSGDTTEGGLLRRQCTAHYKLDPIRVRVREKLGLVPRQVAAGKFHARALIGISLDEAIRMKPSKESWCENVYPLVDARMRREDCLKLLKEVGIPQPVKSACYFCPYHDDRYWSWLKKNYPEDFEKACRVDLAVRDKTAAGVKNPAYLHRSRKPLSEVDFSTEEDRGQMVFGGFGGECEGMCGV